MMLSVIMSIYNPDESEFTETLNSLLTQSYKNFELIIINDGGDKSTLDKYNHLLKLFQYSSIYHLDKNKGLPYALNIAIEKSKGRYIARIDADDICLPNRFEKQIEFLNKNVDIDIVGSWVQCFGGSNRVIKMPIHKNEIFMQTFFNSPLVHPSVMGKREIFELKYDESFLKAQDYELWTRALESGFKISNINKVLLKYRVRNNSNSSIQQLEFAELVRKKFIPNCTFLSESDKNTLLKVSNRVLQQRKVSFLSIVKLYFSLNKEFKRPIYIFKLLLVNYLKLRFKKSSNKEK